MRRLDAARMTHEGLAGTARHLELLDNIHAYADLPVVKPKHEMADSRCQKSDVRGQKTEDGRRKTEDEKKRVRG